MTAISSTIGCSFIEKSPSNSIIGFSSIIIDFAETITGTINGSILDPTSINCAIFLSSSESSDNESE